jgi:hypothetical protein
MLAEAAGTKVDVLMNEVPKAWAMHDTYCQLIPCDNAGIQTYSMIPRIGAFEISYKGILVFSKLLS